MLLQEVSQFQTSVGSVCRIIELADQVQEMYRGSHRSGSVPAVLAKAKAWHTTTQQFVTRLTTNYPLYRDLILPFVEGISQVS